MPGMGRAGCLALACAFVFVFGCSPELGEAPFACSADAACPDGYSCQAAVCVKEGSKLSASHVRRSTFINSGELYWLASPSGGAELIVNDGFTDGARGIFAVRVAPDGTTEPSKALLPYGGEVPMSSSAFELPDGRYGIVTINFPDIDGDTITLTARAIEREPKGGAAPSIETLYTDEEPFLGGVEPAYVSAVAGGSTIDIAWTRPSGGGSVEVVRLAKQGGLWKPATKVREPLPPEILPLSGDCLLWKTGPDTALVRLGYERFAVASFDLAEGAMKPSTPFQLFDDVPVYGWQGSLLLLRYGEYESATASYPVSYVLWDDGGWDPAKQKDVAVDNGGVLQELCEPHTAVPSGSGEGALVGPISEDASFATLSVAVRSPGASLKKVATIARESTDLLYTARAFLSGGRVYLAWLQFHESMMDLWVATAEASGETTGALIRPPERVMSLRGARVEGLRSGLVRRRP